MAFMGRKIVGLRLLSWSGNSLHHLLDYVAVLLSEPHFSEHSHDHREMVISTEKNSVEFINSVPPENGADNW
jgi:hypothetical protein